MSDGSESRDPANRPAKGFAWRRVLRDAAVLVVSVYVAIVLEGISDQRERHQEAVRALGMLQAELLLDRQDLDTIMAAQLDRHVRHRRIDRWMEAGEGLPADSLADDFHMLFSVTRTMFPRSASWTTMVAAGQLADLDDPELVSDLADFYENRNVRLEYNGAFYDEWVTDVARAGVPLVWDQAGAQLLTHDPIEIARLRGRLVGLHDLALGFFTLLEEWGDALDSLSADVDQYLVREGRAPGGQ